MNLSGGRTGIAGCVERSRDGWLGCRSSTHSLDPVIRVHLEHVSLLFYYINFTLQRIWCCLQSSCGSAPENAPKQLAQDSELQRQEDILKAKYGGLLPKKKLMPRDNQYFDSADWQMNKQNGGAHHHLPQPKLQPSNPPPPRRTSQLGGGQ